MFMQPLLRGKEISITYSECVFVASGIQHAMCMHCIVICNHFSLWEELSEVWWKMYIGFRVKYLLFLSDFNETWIFLTDSWKFSNIKFHENPSSGSQFVSYGQTHRYDEVNSHI